MKVVVIGAGWSGVLAAAALRPFVEQVIVLERDPVELARSQRTLAQKKQLHNLLSGGHQAAEALLPGFTASITLAGGIVGTVSSDTNVFEFGRWMPRRELGLTIISAPRLMFEETARRLLNKSGSVTTLENVRATDLIVQDGHIAGVVGLNNAGRTEHWFADLVVDASGGGFKRPPKARPPLSTTRSQQMVCFF